jgi:glycosyltransferase involved in cell wall biosynthesis
MRRIVLFNLYFGGHFPQHLHCLTEYWELHRPPGELHVVVSDRYVRMHPDSAARLEATAGTTLHVAELPASFDDIARSAVARDRLHGRLLARYARSLRPEQLLLMYFDHAQLAIASGLRFPWPLAISGIYFRPSFHYGDLGGPPETPCDRLKGLAKRTVLQAALRNRHLRTIFSLDPFAVPHIARWSRHTEVVALPEPLDVPYIDGDVSLLHGLDPARRRLILFGTIDGKKGISQVLAAMRPLAEEQQRRLALIVAGPMIEAERADLLAEIAEFDAATSVQVLVEDRFLAEHEIQPLLASCDLALLTYQRQHVGSSGVLVRAAAAGVPVLATDYGLVGEQVRRHRLGLTVDATQPAAIRAALAGWIDRPESPGFDADAASGFARLNTAARFTETIFDRLLRRQR